MKNLTFMVWVLLWPLVVAIENYLAAKRIPYALGKPPSPEMYDTGVVICLLINTAVWIGIGWLLYEH